MQGSLSGLGSRQQLGGTEANPVPASSTHGHPEPMTMIFWKQGLCRCAHVKITLTQRLVFLQEKGNLRTVTPTEGRPCEGGCRN